MRFQENAKGERMVSRRHESSLSPEMERAAHEARLLTADDELRLVSAWKDRRDKQALWKLVRAHMRLVLKIAHRYRNYGLPIPDLAQEGHKGILEAAARFEPERGVRFATYATSWIRASMQMYILRNWSMVRGGNGARQRKLFFNLRRLKAELERRSGTSSPREILRQVAKICNAPLSDVEELDRRFSGDVSLDEPATDDEGSARRIDFLIADAPSPEDAALERVFGECHRKLLQAALDELDPRERKIIETRWLSDEQPTLTELALGCGFSKQRAQQLESRAMRKMRKSMLAGGIA